MYKERKKNEKKKRIKKSGRKDQQKKKMEEMRSVPLHFGPPQFLGIMGKWVLLLLT